MDSLQILQLCPFFHPVLGGLERVVLRLSASMVARGHHVTVFTSDLSRHGRIDHRSSEIEGVKVYRFPSWFRIGPFASFWPAFCTAARTHHFDVIHAHSYRHPHCDLASLPSVRGQAKLVLQPHWPEYPRSTVGSLLARTYDGALARRLFRSCDLVLALTPLEVPWLRARGARKIKVLPNGVPEGYFGPYIGQGFREEHGIDGFFALSVGRIDESKGFHFVVEALRLVDGVRYVIVGPRGDYYQKLVNLIRANRLEHRVTLLGELTERDLLRALDASDAFIQPSLFEAFGVSTLEALARGKPCIGSRVGGLQWLLQECGLLTEPGDVTGIARSLQALRDQDGLRHALGVAGRARAADLTWDRISTAYEEILLELVDQ